MAGLGIARNHAVLSTIVEYSSKMPVRVEKVVYLKTAKQALGSIGETGSAYRIHLGKRGWL